MTYMVARFDLDETPRVRNTPRPTPKRSVLPVDFPFVIDDDTGEVAEPLLLHLVDKFYPATVRGRNWKRNSADAAAADLKAWWINLASKGHPWDRVNDRVLADYLVDMRSEVSGHTLDFLADSTFRRRVSSIVEFYKFALAKWQLTTVPSLVNARIIAPTGTTTMRVEDVEGTDEEAHPIDDKDVHRIAELLGPLPSERRAVGSSRSRLAFELGIHVGLRIDEIVNLRPSMFRKDPDNDPDGVLKLRITHTKGLNPRTVHIPNELVAELRQYIAHEREESLAAARRTWLTEKCGAPTTLLLNQPDAGANAGKRVRPATVEMDFALAVATLGLTRQPKQVAVGTEFQREVEVARHVFHDARHTYALWSFEEFDRRPRRPNGRASTYDEAIGFVQRRLGHRDPATTRRIYLDVFNELATEGVHHLQRGFRRRRAEAKEASR